MRRSSPIFFVFLVWVCCPLAFAALSVRASVDRTVVFENEPVLLSVEVENGDGAESIQIPEDAAYRVQNYGTSNQTSIVNGQVSRSIQYNYQLTPRKTGVLTVPEISVSVGGQVFKTEPITLRVQTAEEQELSQSQNGGGVGAHEVIVELRMDKTTLYVDEPAVLRFRLLRRQDVNFQFQDYEPPALKEFLSEPYGKQQNGRENRQGMLYEVAELKTLLYPTQAGTFEVGPAAVSGQVLKRMESRQRNRGRRGSSPLDDFFGGSLFDNDPFFNSNVAQIPLNRKTNTLSVIVKPLPQAGKPAGFSGTVGHYKMTVETTDLRNVKKGDPITLTMTLAGTGHVASIAEPRLQNLRDFKTFESEAQVTPMINDEKIAGQKVFKKVIVPEKTGRLKLPTVCFDFFDPLSGTYQSQTWEGVEIQVAEGQNDPNAGKVYEASASNPSDSQTPKKENIQLLGQDILFSRPDPGFLKPSAAAFSWVSLGLFCGTGVAAYGILFFLVQGARRRRNDPARVRESSAHKQFKNDISRISPKNPDRENFSALQKALSAYIGNKLNLAGAILTPRELEEKLRPLGFPEALCQELRTQAETLDQWQYGLAPSDPEAWKRLFETVGQTVSNIEQSWRKIKK